MQTEAEMKKAIRAQRKRDGKIVRLALETLYLYGQNDKHNVMALWGIIEMIDPKVSRYLGDHSEEAAYDKYVRKPGYAD